jgi:hypothetical protein
MQQPGHLDSRFPIKFAGCADLINQTSPTTGFVLDRDEIYNGVLTPQARTAHQPIHASKAQNSPIEIKIAASTDASGIRQAPARTKTTAILPRATRPLLSMFGFIQ